MGYSDRKCKGCQDSMSYDSYARDVTFMGGYTAKACHDCRNAWSEYLNGHHCLDRLNKAETRVQAVKICFNTTGKDMVEDCRLALQDAHDEYAAARVAMFALTKEFLASRNPVEEEVEIED